MLLFGGDHLLSTVTITSNGISKTLDHDVFMHLAKTYSSNHATMSEGSVCKNEDYFPDGITNGFSWYRLEGKKNFVFLYSS